MMDTIFFDLDGTMLCMDLKHFEKLYFKALAEDLSDLAEPTHLAQSIWASTEAMVRNLEHRTNEEIFLEDFQTRINGDIEIYKKRFDKFYDDGFLKTRDAVSGNQYMQKSIRLLKEKGYRIVVATNPLFPLKAIHHRIRWAGFEPSEFEYVSHYEGNHYCKPQLKYYEEILEDIGKNASECMMVGNDVQEDLVAGKLGMRTYLIKDNIIHRTELAIEADHMGSYEDFLGYVETLPAI